MSAADDLLVLERVFPGDSEMAGRMRAFDWSKTDLGPPGGCPENLRIAVSLCLTSRFPILLWWGTDSRASRSSWRSASGSGPRGGACR